MNEAHPSRDQIIDLVTKVRNAHDHGYPPEDGWIAQLEAISTYTNPSSMCTNTDLPEETIADIFLGWDSSQRALTREELIALVERIGQPAETEAVSILRVCAFQFNCRHPASTDLIFYPEEYFDGRPDPTPGEIVDLALRGG